MIMGYLAIDFGGTRLRAAWFDEYMTMQHRDETLTRAEQPQDDILRRIIDTARGVVPPGCQPDAIGIAAPGPLDAKAGVIFHAETLPGWRDVPLAQHISAAFDRVPTFINNDANISALAEAYFGAAQDADPVIYMTISTGIGGGAVISGSLFTGWHGMAIEPGHMRFKLPDGEVRRLEELASGTALGQIAAARLNADTSVQSVLRDAETITGQAVGEAATDGDAFALGIVREAGEWLGLGMVNLLHLFNPQAVVLGGSVTKLGDLLLEPVRETIRANLLSPLFYDESLIRLAALGEDVCLYGAAHYAQTQSRWQT